MRNVINKDSDATFIYETDDLSVSQWRSIMLVCQAYEKCLLDGQNLSPKDFASNYLEIPQHVLLPELERIHHEFHEESALYYRDTEQVFSQSERYLILEEIRSGGMGQVFRAFDRTCGRLVALKRIRKELAQEPQIRRRFLAEVELTADLEHPGVIPIYDQSVDSEGREFYVMRLIDGAGTGTLQQAIQRFHTMNPDNKPPGIDLRGSRNWNSEKRASFRNLIESVLVIADTTAHAHSRGIAHRDLKPSNILVGPYGETLIADWGLAKRINRSGATLGNEQDNDSNNLNSFVSTDHQSRWSSNAQGVGTPGFRAPEMHSGCSSTNLVAADIYSLGSILDCVITGSLRPHDDAAFRKNEINAPSSILPLIAIAHKAMSREVVDRYPNAQSMRTDLSNWLAGEPVSAYPESLVEQIWKWPSRHRIAASSIASALMIAVIGFAWFSWFQKTQNEKLSQTLNTATVLLEENQKAKRSLEEAFAQREALALHAIIEFQSLLTLNPSLQSDLQFRTVREKILKESRSFYQNLASSFEQSEKNDSSLERLSDAALALVQLENELGNFSQAIEIAESAYQRLRDYQAPSHRVEFQLGRMLAFKGNIQTRHGWKKQGQEDQEQAVRHLEPLLDSSELSQKERKNATLLWSRAASPFAIGLAAKGDFQSAKELLQKILTALEGLEPESFEGLLLEIQSYGNLAMVFYYSKDTPGAYEALEQSGLCATKCEHLMDGSVPFREIVDFEVMRSMLVRFKSDLMLTEGKIDPAIEMQNQSLLQLTKAVDHYPGNMDIHNAYVSCITRLQAVLFEHGRIARANEVTQAWLELAQRIRQTDESNPNTHEFLLLAYHTMGHLSEATQQVSQAQQHYHEALSIAKNILSGNPQSERLLAQVIELNVHLIGFDLRSDDLQSAQAHFEQAIEYASKLKSLPDKTDQYQSGIKNQLQAALRFLQDSAHNNKSDQWIARLREFELLQ
jgi:serine/threonine protein kinase